MHRTPKTHFASAILGLGLLGCTAEVPPPNPLSGQPISQDGSSLPAGPGTDGNDRTAPDSQGESTQTGPNWVKVDEIPLDGPLLEVAVATSDTCCGKSKARYDESPARFYLASDDGSLGLNGFLLWLDEDDQVVLSRQTEPGLYAEEIYRSTKPAGREDGKVQLSCPSTHLGAGPLYIWSGSRSPSFVAGKQLPDNNPDGGIPAFLLVLKSAASKGEDSTP